MQKQQNIDGLLDSTGSPRLQRVSRDREVVSLKRKLEVLSCQVRDHNLAKKREIENKERLANINNSYILKKQAAVSIVEKFKEPYEAIQKII